MIKVNLDTFTLGDMEALDGDSFTDMMEVFDKCVTLEGVAENKQAEELRKLHWRTLKDINIGIKEAIEAETNPEVEEKN